MAHDESNRSKPWLGVVLTAPLALTLAAAAGWPLAVLAAGALRGGAGSGFEGLLSARLVVALRNSLLLSAGAAVASVALSLPAAWTLARARGLSLSVVRAAFVLPLSFSGVMVGFLMMALLGRAGAVPRLAAALTGTPLLAGGAYTSTGLFLAYLYFEVPRAAMTLEAAIRRLPPELDDAARSLGASPLESGRRVAWPILLPAVRSALALTFSTSLGSFGAALILARRFTVAPLEAYSLITAFRDDATAGALCVALAAAALGADALLSRETA